MAPHKLLVALNRLLWYQCPQHMAKPRSTDSEEAIVEYTINLGGHHGNSTYPGHLRRHFHRDRSSNFMVPI